MRVSEAQVPGGLAPLTRPPSEILKKLRDPGAFEALWLPTFARYSVTGPWWLSGQVSHCSFKVSPALTGMEFDVDLALLWQAMSDVPKLFGSTKPENVS